MYSSAGRRCCLVRFLFLSEVLWNSGAAARKPADPNNGGLRYRLHLTPASASWLNPVERFFAGIARRRIRRGTFTYVRGLEQAIQDYLQHYNRNPKPLVWTATAHPILSKVQRFCE